MESCMRFAAAAVIAFLPLTAQAAGGEEEWSAESKTAMFITGDITLSSSRLAMANGASLLLRVAAGVRNFGSGPVAARILTVTQPANPALLRRNRLCDAPVRWVAVWRIGDSELGMAVFSGAAQPSGKSLPGLCGTFTYSRAE
jgi:hypothetical protein